SPVRIASPDGQLSVDFHLDANGAPRYAVNYAGHPVLQESRLGLVRDDADFTTGLRIIGQDGTKSLHDHYEIVTAKRRVNDYRARQKVIRLQTSGGEKKLNLVFQVSND